MGTLGAPQMEHRVRFAPDAAMPSDDMWLFCRTDEALTLFIRESAMECGKALQEHFLEEMWAAFRALDGGRVPAQRTSA